MLPVKRNVIGPSPLSVRNNVFCARLNLIGRPKRFGAVEPCSHTRRSLRLRALILIDASSTGHHQPTTIYQLAAHERPIPSSTLLTLSLPHPQAGADGATPADDTTPDGNALSECGGSEKGEDTPESPTAGGVIAEASLDRHGGEVGSSTRNGLAACVSAPLPSSTSHEGAATGGQVDGAAADGQPAAQQEGGGEVDAAGCEAGSGGLPVFAQFHADGVAPGVPASVAAAGEGAAAAPPAAQAAQGSQELQVLTQQLQLLLSSLSDPGHAGGMVQGAVQEVQDSIRRLNQLLLSSSDHALHAASAPPPSSKSPTPAQQHHQQQAGGNGNVHSGSRLAAGSSVGGGMPTSPRKSGGASATSGPLTDLSTKGLIVVGDGSGSDSSGSDVAAVAQNRVAAAAAAAEAPGGKVSTPWGAMAAVDVATAGGAYPPGVVMQMNGGGPSAPCLPLLPQPSARTSWLVPMPAGEGGCACACV